MNYLTTLETAANNAKKAGHSILLLEHVLDVLIQDDEVTELISDFSGEIDLAKVQELLKTELDSFARTAVGKVKHGSSVTRTIDMLNLDSKTPMTATIPDGFSAVLQVLAMDIADAPERGQELAKALHLQGLEKYFFKVTHGVPMPEESKEAQKKADNNSDSRKLLDTLHPTNETIELFGSQNTFDDLIAHINSNNGNVTFLIGNALSGKTKLIEHLVNTINDDEFEGEISGTSVLSTRTEKLTNFDLNANMRGILISATRQESILVIEDIHKFHSYAEQAAIMPMLIAAAAKGQRVVCTTTEHYFNKVISPAPNAAYINTVEIKTPQSADFNSITEYHCRKLSEQYALTISDETIIELQTTIWNKVHSDKLKSSLRAAELAFSYASILGSTEITRDNIYTAISVITNQKRESIDVTRAKKLSELGETVSKVIYGQDEAISRIESGIQVSSLGLKENADAPRGVFMLLGSTGVGKTESATQFAKAMGKEIVILDMSEYQESHTVSKILGSPAGYVGHNDGDGILYDRLKKSPDAFVLFDELEKAHPAVFKLLLGLLDRGVMTTSTNKEINLRDNFIFFTSNVGTVTNHSNTFGLGKNAGKNVDKAHQKSKDQERFVEYRDDLYVNHFTPEFRSRIDTKIVYNPINLETALRIAKKSSLSFIEKVKDTYGIEVKISDDVISSIATKHYAQADGARKISFGFKDDVIAKASQFILRALNTEKLIKAISIELKDDELTFTAN